MRLNKKHTGVISLVFRALPLKTGTGNHGRHTAIKVWFFGLRKSMEELKAHH